MGNSSETRRKRRPDKRIGYFLSCEEYSPHELVDQAWAAADAGFDCLWISDHHHPWNDEQGQSAFVWSVIGAVSQICELPVTTAVTCPTRRIHPAVIAQAAASCAVLLNGRLTLGVGTGEALNEHITGEVWPHEDVRLGMLEEAVDIIRRLWSGEVVSHQGRYYTVDTARIYSLPEEPPPIYVSGFGPKSIDLAGRIGDGFISTQPDAAALQRFRAVKGAAAPAEAGVKVAYASTAEVGDRSRAPVMGLRDPARTEIGRGLTSPEGTARPAMTRRLASGVRGAPREPPRRSLRRRCRPRATAQRECLTSA